MTPGLKLQYFCYYFILIQDLFEPVNIKRVRKYLMTKESTSFKNYLMDEITKYHHPNEYFMMILFSKNCLAIFRILNHLILLLMLNHHSSHILFHSWILWLLRNDFIVLFKKWLVLLILNLICLRYSVNRNLCTLLI